MMKFQATNTIDDHEAIFGPFLAMILFTACVWMYMYALRAPFFLDGTRTKKFTNEQLLQQQGMLDKLSPQSVRLPSDNLKNLFEVPTLF